MRIFYLSIILLFSTASLALNIYEIDSTKNEVDLQNYIYHYQDTANSILVNDVLTREWEKLEITPTFSSSEYIHWFKYSLTNPYSTKIERYFFIPYHYIKEISVYAVRKDSTELLMLTGTSQPFSNKDVKSTGYPIKIILEPFETVDYIFKFKHLYLPLRATVFIVSKDNLETIITKSFSILWLWKGVYSTVLIIALFLFIFIRQRIFLYYIALNIGIGTYIAIQLGEFFVYFNYDPASYISILDYSGSLLINIFIFLFLNELTPIKKRNPYIWKWTFRLIYGLIAIWVIRLIPEARESMFMHYSHLYVISVSILIFSLTPILLLNSVFRKDKNAFALFLIFSFYVVEGFSETILPNLGLFADSPFVNYGILLASFTEMFAFMLIMAKESLNVYKEREKLMIQQQQHQTQMVQSIVKSQEEERNRVGRELHDSLGANMAIIKQQVKKSDEALYSVVSQSIEMVRNLSHSLVTPEIKNEEFKDELKELCHLFSSEKIKVKPYFYEWPNITDTTITIHLYRIIQELLKNAVEHSQSKHVYLQFMGDEEQQINIIYEDNGIGFDPAKNTTKGLGLKNIQNRLELLNGSMRLDTSKTTKGTTIFIEVKL